MENQVEPLLSIIIPVYNAHNTIKRCLDSIVNQDYHTLQIITINDGSTDNSLDILNEYKEKDSRVIVISKENSGQAAARNEGLKKVSGEYFMYLDADDELISNSLKKIMDEFLKHQDVDILGYSYDIVKDNNVRTILRSPLNEIITDKDTLMLGLVSNDKLNQTSRITTAPWGKILKSKFKDIVFDKNFRVYEDVNYSIDIINKCNSYLNTDIKVLRVYDTKGSSTKKGEARDDIGMLHLTALIRLIKSVNVFTKVAVEKITLLLLHSISLDQSLKDKVKDVINKLPKFKISKKVKLLKTVAMVSPKTYKRIFDLIMFIKKR